MSSKFQNDAIFWVSVDKIRPNPYQPRRDFNEESLRDLAESIRQYGVLQPLTVTRNEETKEDGGLKVHYELIAGERRHRAAQMANLSQVPVIIRSEQEDSQVKLELAIIENLQREDLNPIERAEAFDKLADEFDFTHKKIAEKIGKSREYVSNSMRLLKLPEKIKQAIIGGKMTEGHARPVMMLRDNPEKQETLFKEIIHKGLTVREAEEIARRDAQDKVRKKKNKVDPETKELEEKLSETFGTRVKIEERDVGGKLVIDFFSNEDLESIIELMRSQGEMEMSDMMEEYVSSVAEKKKEQESESDSQTKEESMAETLEAAIASARAKKQEKEEEEEETDPKENQEVRSESVSSAPKPKKYQDNKDNKKEENKVQKAEVSQQEDAKKDDTSEEVVIGRRDNQPEKTKNKETNHSHTVSKSESEDEQASSATPQKNQLNQRESDELQDEELSSTQSRTPNSAVGQNKDEIDEVSDVLSKSETVNKVEEPKDQDDKEENKKAKDNNVPEEDKQVVEPSVPTSLNEDDQKEESDEPESSEEDAPEDSEDDMYAVSNFSI